MRRFAMYVTLALLFQSQIGFSQSTTCSSFNSSNKALNPVEPSNTTEHQAGGLHAWGLTPVFGCTYTHGSSQNCNTQCTVTSSGSDAINPLGATITVETGALSVAGTHQVSGGWNPGNAFGTGTGANCQGTIGAGATNCFIVPFTKQCFISVSATAGGVTVNTNGTTVWSSGPVPVTNSCPAKADPQAIQSGGGGSGPGCDPTVQKCVCASVPLQGPDGTLIMECDPGTSPIIVDTNGHGFQLTSAADGVLFDISGDGHPIRLGWTATGSGNAFLALPDSSGVVKNGTQLFGNFTPQPPSSSPNGFLALAVYDKPDHGGNDDGVVDSKDQIFSSLRLWIDENHDGICQPDELHKLPDLGVLSIALSYSLSHRVDQFGNVFRYRADINSGIPGKSSVDRKAFDVFFTDK